MTSAHTRMHETKSYSCSKCVLNYLKRSRVFGKPLLDQSQYHISSVPPKGLHDSGLKPST